MSKGSRCSICRKATHAEFRPFCSRQCRDVDLSRWLGGGYAIVAPDESLMEDRPSDGDGLRKRAPDGDDR